MDTVDSVDQREPHKNEDAREVTKKDLDALGVLSWEGLTGVGKHHHHHTIINQSLSPSSS